MPNANSNLNGLGALASTALGKPGESSIGGVLGSAVGNATLGATASGLAVEGLGSASAAQTLSNSANSLANQVLGNLSAAASGTQGATAAMKDWTNGLAMPPLAAMAQDAASAVSLLPGGQIAALGADVVGLSTAVVGGNPIGISLPPLAGDANSMLGAAQTIVPTLAGQTGLASTELGKLASAVGDSKDFAGVMADPVAVFQKGAQAINMDPRHTATFRSLAPAVR